MAKEMRDPFSIPTMSFVLSPLDAKSAPNMRVSDLEYFNQRGFRDRFVEGL